MNGPRAATPQERIDPGHDAHPRPGVHDRWDVAIVGSGIVGLAHAIAALRYGLKVAVIDRAAEPWGASTRNFGHLCITGQSGRALDYARRSRELWQGLAPRAGFWLNETGAVVVAQADDELEVLREFRALRGEREVVLLSAEDLEGRLPVATGLAVGGALLPQDLQIDPREAVSSLRRWLGEEGVSFFMATNVVGVESGSVHTTRGTVRAETVVVATGDEVASLFPAIAEAASLGRCGLDMMLVDADLRSALTAPLLTGWSLARYAGFGEAPGAGRLRDRLRSESPDLAALDVNQMYTQRPDGSLIVGDTHYRGPSIPPFQDEDAFEALLDLARRLFGLGCSQIRVRERWQGVYAQAPEDFLIAAPSDGVRVVSVTTGIGMTTALGLGESVIGQLHARSALSGVMAG